MDDGEVLNRIFHKLDQFDSKIDNLCDRATKVETKFDLFIDALNKRDAEIKQNIENRYKKITAIFGTITSVSVLIGIAKVFQII